MPIVIPNQGATPLLRFTLGSDVATGYTWSLHLFQNNYTPEPGTDLGEFTEASFTGYSSKPVDPETWGSPTIISNRASSTYADGEPFEWTNSGSAQTIYGYWVQINELSACIFAERFATSRTLQPGDKLDLTLIFTGGTQT